MKKILYLHAGAEMYGADKILLELVEGIDKTRYTPVVILPEEGILVDAFINAGIDVRVMHYPIVRRKYFTPFGIFQLLFSYLFYSIKLVSFVRQERIDIVHVNTTAVWEGVWIKCFSRAKIVWHVHEIITHPAIIFKIVSFLVEHFSDRVVAVSNATRKHLLDSGLVQPAKVQVLHNGIDATLVCRNQDTSFRRKLGLGSDMVVIGMVGRINAWKGQGDFLQAVIPVLEINLKSFAVIVGSPYRGEEERLTRLQEKIDEQPESIKSRIKIISFQKDVSKIYALFDVFVLPSTSPDPFPTVVLEAMANGLPIVGYSHGGITEMVVNNVTGFVVQPNEPAAITTKLLQLVENQDLRIEIGEQAMQRQRQLFDLHKFITSFQQIYDSLA